MAVYWLKYTLHLPKAIEESFSHEILNSTYTLGWIEPQVEVIATNNGYNYAEKTDLPLTAYIFEPVVDSEAKHLARFEEYLTHWDEDIKIVAIEQVEEENETWKDQFHSVCVGNWLVAPSWTSEEEKAGYEHILYIDPGAAFGTGYHGTTQDILLFLQELPLTDKRILDIGAGSGILSIFSLRSGSAKPVWAVDINPESFYEITQNLLLNRLDESAIRVIIADASQADMQNKLPEQVDLIYVNIGSEEDITMLPVVQKCLAQGGWLLLSGIVEWIQGEVEEVYARSGFRVAGKRQTDEWVTLLLQYE